MTPSVAADRLLTTATNDIPAAVAQEQVESSFPPHPLRFLNTLKDQRSRIVKFIVAIVLFSLLGFLIDRLLGTNSGTNAALDVAKSLVREAFSAAVLAAEEQHHVSSPAPTTTTQ